jgi:hypothetical protein
MCYQGKFCVCEYFPENPVLFMGTIDQPGASSPYEKRAMKMSV